MQVGLIPPRGLENFALGSNLHLALALPVLMSRKVYAGMYARASVTGDFVIVDNGAAEGALVGHKELMHAAEVLYAHEIVAPDVLRDGPETVRFVKTFLSIWKPQVRVMGVVQGINMPEFKNCVRQFADMGVHTLGIPRHMIKTLDTKSARIDLANWVLTNFPERFEMHFLGTAPTWVEEVKYANKYTKIRSVDTSLPFNFALRGEELSTCRDVISRPIKYFEDDWSRKVSAMRVRRNVETLLDWAGAPPVTRPKVDA